MSDFNVTASGGPATVTTSPTDGPGTQLVVGPARQDPIQLQLNSDCKLIVYYDYNTSSLKSRRFGDDGAGGFNVGSPVTIVSGIQDQGFAGFVTCQKVLISFNDSNQNKVRFAVSFDDGGSWTLDSSSG